MESCEVCAAFAGQGSWRDLLVHEDELVVLAHVPPSNDEAEDAYAGHLLLLPKRHVESPATLLDAEAERLGLWMAWGTRLLESEVRAEHVYVVRFGDSWPHLHIHLLPRYPGTPRAYRGMDVREWPDAKRHGRAEVATLARKLRNAAGVLAKGG